MMSQKLLRIVGLALALGVLPSTVGCYTPRRVTSPHRNITSRRSPLGVNDVFAVRVMGEQDLSMDCRVYSNGTIIYPHIGAIRVVGMEPYEVADLISRQLREHEILRDPQVSVMVTQVNSRRISVFGQVQHPGMLDYVQGMDIVMAVSAAGGFTPLANRGSVRVTRRSHDGATRSFEVHVDEIAEGRADNFELEPGDIIFVPESVT
jgi:polysaccharide export outer membrane protein